MRKFLLAALTPICFLSTAAAAQSPVETLEIPFDQEIHIVRESVENSAEELLLTLLFTSDPEVAADADVEICEFESSDIEESIREYREKMSASGCGAVRIRYRYAPSPIPADAELIFAQIDFGRPAFEFIYTDPAYFESAGSDGVLANRFLQRRSELTVAPSFFGENGARAYDAIPKMTAPQIADWAPATRDRYRISLADVLFGKSHFELDAVASRQYVHRDFSEHDWNMVGNDKAIETIETGTRFLLDGKMIGGTGSGGDGRYADEEQFDGPIHMDRYSMAFNHAGLMTATPEMRLYRMNWVFYAEPKLRFAFTPDGKTIYHWTTALNYRPTFRVDFPGIEKIRIPDPDDPHRSFSQ